MTDGDMIQHQLVDILDDSSTTHSHSDFTGGVAKDDDVVDCILGVIFDDDEDL